MDGLKGTDLLPLPCQALTSGQIQVLIQYSRWHRQLSRGRRSPNTRSGVALPTRIGKGRYDLG